MLKSYNFWIRLVAVLVLLLRIVGAELGFNVDSGLIIDLATAIASVLVVLGVIQVPVQKIDCYIPDNSSLEKNQNGGVFMKTFEQIKEDLLKVKEKLGSGLDKESGLFGEIALIIDGIIGEKDEEKEVIAANKQTEVEAESVVLTTEETAEPETIIVKPEEVGEVMAEPDAETCESLTVEEVEVAGAIIAQENEGIENNEFGDEASEFAEKLVDDVIYTVNEFITEEEKQRVDKDKLNLVIREKIAQLLATQLDEILHDATI